MIGVFLLALGLAVAAIWLGVTKSTSDTADPWFEVAKAGLQLFGIALVGGTVAWGFKILEERREDDRKKAELDREDRLRLDEYRAGVASELWEAYRQVKSSRRRLQAAGWRRLLLAPQASGSGTGPSERQIAELGTQMAALDVAQLTIEKLENDVKTQSYLYSPKNKPIEALLDDAQSYVNHVLDDWQANADQIEAGADASQLPESLPNIRNFLGPARLPGGVKELSNYVAKAAALIQSLRFKTEPDFKQGS